MPLADLLELTRTYASDSDFLASSKESRLSLSNSKSGSSVSCVDIETASCEKNNSLPNIGSDAELELVLLQILEAGGTDSDLIPSVLNQVKALAGDKRQKK